MRFAETMSGTIEWDAEPGKQHPFRFEVEVKNGQMDGLIYAPPIADGAHATGTILIRPIVQRIIRYELAFTGKDGKRYEMVGQKDISWRRPITTLTTLPAEILDEDHRRVATCSTRFDYQHDLWSFLRSFRPA